MAGWERSCCWCDGWRCVSLPACLPASKPRYAAVSLRAPLPSAPQFIAVHTCRSARRHRNAAEVASLRELHFLPYPPVCLSMHIWMRIYWESVQLFSTKTWQNSAGAHLSSSPLFLHDSIPPTRTHAPPPLLSHPHAPSHPLSCIYAHIISDRVVDRQHHFVSTSFQDMTR